MNRWEPQAHDPPGGAARLSVQAPAPEPVGFDARLAALIIDGVWLLTAAVLLSPLLDRLKAPSAAAGPGLDSADFGAALALVLWLLYSATEVLTPATLGKRLLDVRVARLGGRPSTVRRRAVRWLVKGSPLLLFALPPAVRLACKAFPALASAAGAAGLALPGAAEWADQLSGDLYGAAVVAAGCVGVGGLWVLLPGARALHDRAAGTAVYCDADVAVTSKAGHGFPLLFRAVPLRGRQAGHRPAPCTRARGRADGTDAAIRLRLVTVREVNPCAAPARHSCQSALAGPSPCPCLCCCPPLHWRPGPRRGPRRRWAPASCSATPAPTAPGGSSSSATARRPSAINSTRSVPPWPKQLRG